MTNQKYFALSGMFIILGVLLIFHTLILLQIIPYDQVWAGRLESVQQMQQYESVSLLINIFILVVLLRKRKLLLLQKQHKAVDLLIWVFVVFFALNTLGNLFAESVLEMALGGATTLLSSILCYLIVRKH